MSASSLRNKLQRRKPNEAREGRAKPALLFYRPSYSKNSKSVLAARRCENLPVPLVSAKLMPAARSHRDLFGQFSTSRKENIVRNPIAIALAVLSLSCAPPRFIAAAETVKVAVPNRGVWDTSYTELGLQQGFFKEQGLDVQIIH